MRRLRGSRRFEGTYGSRSATPSMREKRYEAIPRKASYCRDTSARSTDRRQLLVPDPAAQGAASVWPRILSWFGTMATAFASPDRQFEAYGVRRLVPRPTIQKSPTV